jgi:hypothetical protein
LDFSDFIDFYFILQGVRMILFESDWHNHAVNHLKSEALARGLIKNAATALAENHAGDGLIFWIEAAQGGAHVLNVLKGLHQPKGVYNEVLHMRMRLYVPDTKKGALLYENTNFQTDFHLYSTILNPQASPGEFQLQPTKLTYQTAGHDPQNGPFTEIVIANARILTNNLK